MAALTPEQRSLRARLAAHTLHAQGGTTTTAARAARAQQFERQVDPDGVLEPAERARRAAHAQQAHMLAMALKSAKARSRST